jgi:primosomal protein N' (replication factor Y)
MIAAVSAGPSDELVELTAFGAWRWAGPRAAFLRAASAPNVVPVDRVPEIDVAIFPPSPSPLAMPDERVRLVVWPPALARIDVVRALVEPTGSTLVLVPDADEAFLIAAALRDEGRHLVLVRGDHPAAQRTAAWDDARRGACVVIGGRVAAFAPVPDLTGVIVLDDADGALAEERAPAWHARDLVAERACRAGATLSLLTPVPTTEAVELAGQAIVSAPARLAARGWPRVRAIDMRDEPPGSALLSSALGPALHAALDANGRALCILNRRGRAHLIVCRSCGTIARCARCDARVVEGDGVHRCERCDAVEPARCRSCGAGVFTKLRPGVTSVRDAVAGLVVRHRVIAVDAASAPLPAFDVAVGTEALLHRAGTDPSRPIRLVAFLDFDQELLAPRFRAAEQALWLLVRAARLLGPTDGGGELLVQTRVADDEVLAAATSGDPTTVVASERARRTALALPPFGGVAEVRGDAVAVSAACDLLRSRLTVVGPTGARALLRAPTIAALCDALADVDLAPARAHGRLRVDVDPLRI